SESIDSINFEEYIHEFASELLNTSPNDISISVTINRPSLSIEKTVPLGLIFNELLTNSIKHAKVDQKLKISIKYKKTNTNEKFTYIDNGKGVFNMNALDKNKVSLGLTLIETLSSQLESKIEYKSDEQGFKFTIEGNFD
ncbi:MAG: sensor histidine kinase, partial [Flavobacteriales bacterium]|nr:sensor histidine kinase [Flavobacteriales bacterium]